jgi:integrase
MSQVRLAKAKNAIRGQVHVKNDGKGNLTLQMPSNHAQYYYGLKQKYISFGAKDTPQNRIAAMTAAIEMNNDLELGVFDPQKAVKYQHLSKQSTGRYEATLVSNEANNLLCLYKDFVKQLTLAETTRKTLHEGTLLHYFSRMVLEEGYGLNQQSQIYNWVKKNIGVTNAREALRLFYRLIEWAKREQRLPENFNNKFKEYEQEFSKAIKRINTSRKLPKAVANLMPREGIKAWTEAERDLIIEAFYARKKTGRNLYGVDHLGCLIEFFFNTGCRHGEAFALTWGDISADFKTMHISKSYAGKIKIVKGTKTGKVRTVPLNLKTQELLKRLKSDDVTTDTLVFRNTEGGYYQTANISSTWCPSKETSIIKRLIKSGALTCYLDMYSTRRTFVSLQINKGVPVTTVAKWIGDNPETVLKHYARPDDDAVPY